MAIECASDIPQAPHVCPTSQATVKLWLLFPEPEATVPGVAFSDRACTGKSLARSYYAKTGAEPEEACPCVERLS
jgi:hypothetical protein